MTGGSENGKSQLSSKGDQTFHSLIGIMELFITQLGLSPTHAHFIENARHALVEIAGERKRNVEELRAEEERYRLVNRATNDVIWDWNLVTGELLWNEALKTTFGYSPDEVPKTLEWWDRVLHPEDRERAVESILAMIADPTKTSWTNEYRMRHADGHWINVLDRGIISRDERGRGVRMIGSMVDLTERVRREEELHLAVQRFETLANMMPQIVWSTRPDGYHDYFNDRWYEFTGMPREKDQGWNWKNYLHPDDVQRSLEVWHRSLMTGQNYEVQYRFRRAADGTYRWFIGRAMPIRDREGKITRWFGTCTDIDDQRREEAKLEALVAERTAELEQQATMLRHLAAELTSAEQRERRRLAALLHDDLQQVLVAARMQVSMLGRHVQGEAGARAVGQAQKWIEEAANTARDLSRELRPPVLYEGGLAAALRGLASEMEERHHLKVEIDARDPGEAIADDTKALLFECVRELLFNAAKHAKVEQAKLAMWEDADCLRLSVSDHGCGFNVGTLSGDKRSTGFGLYSIRERLAALGGELKINSQPGSGTEIDPSIPVAQETADQAPASPRPRQRTKQRDPLISNDHRTHILVVDDHAVVREGIAAILGSDERLCVVGQASNGIEAIECAERNQPEVMLMDLNMPYMNGIEATQEILRRWPEMKIIGLSVQDDETTAQAMLNAGATAFLPKAGDSDKMISAILKVITR